MHFTYVCYFIVISHVFFFIFSLPKPEYIRAPGAYRMYDPKVGSNNIIIKYNCPITLMPILFGLTA